MLLTVEEVAKEIRQELRGKLRDGLVLDENTRLEDIGMSSLQMAEVVFSLEERYEVEFDTSRAADVKTIGDIVELGNAALAGEPEEPKLAEQL